MELGEDFSGAFIQNMRSVVSLIDNLRDAGLNQYVRLPSIITLGIQSSGKSSVLESIVGLNFLPRNEGVCTRRPLELRLVHTEMQVEPWAEFEEVPGKIKDFNEVRRTIEQLTDNVAGRRKGIVDKPIVMTIHSQTCPDLTLIDLPGITRIPLEGSDQKEDIEKITKGMAMRYISDPRSIILCVCAANADLSTSDALLMAKKVDKQGIRTIGVITKIDIMDKGTNAEKVLLNKEIPLRLGYVGVVNRSQEDINNNKRVEEALQDERAFFASHNIYSRIPPGFLGVANLSQKLSKTMFGHISHTLPEILRETMQRINDCEARLRELGPSMPAEAPKKMQLLWNMVSEFSDAFKNSIRGKYDKKNTSRLSKDLVGGVAVKAQFYDLLNSFISYKPTSDISPEELKRALILHEGDSIPGFPSVDAFVSLLWPHLEKLREPVLDCLQNVHSSLDLIANKIIERCFYRLPSVLSDIADVVSQALVDERDVCRKILEDLLDAEETYVFTNDIDYLTSQSEAPRSGQEKAEVNFNEEIKSRIDAYFHLVVRNIRDTAPKIIGTFLVRAAIENIHMKLYKYISTSERLLDKMNEPPLITNEREMLIKQRDVLKKAERIMKHDPQIVSEAENFEVELREQDEKLKKAPEPKKTNGLGF